MSSFVLKSIAYIFVIIDHCTIVFGWNNELRCVTRVAFPIFAYLISEGCKYTGNLKKYILRLFICGFISYLICVIMNGEIFLKNGMNVLFTFSVSCIGIYIFEELSKHQNIAFLKYWVIFTAMTAAEFFRFDYGFTGVFLVFLFYICKNKKYQIISLAVFTTVKYRYFIFTVFNGFFYGTILNILNNQNIMHGIYSAVFTFAASLFIYFYNGKKGFSIKYLFYFIYPIHIFIILALA